MKHLNAVVAVAALALMLCTVGCQEKQQEEAAVQTSEVVAAPPYPYDQIPDQGPAPEEAQPALTQTAEPEIHEIDTIEPAPAPAKPKTTVKPKEKYAAPKPASRTYVVRKGDTLGEISQKMYGTSKNWRKIFNANKGKLKDPNMVPIGTKLVIP